MAIGAVELTHGQLPGAGLRRRRARGWRGRAADGVDADLPQRVAVGRGPRGAVDAQVATGAADGQRLGAAGAGRGRVDRRPRGAVGRQSGSGTPSRTRSPTSSTTWQIGRLAPRSTCDPLRVAERARPAGAGVAVERGRGRGAGVLGRRRGGRLAERRVGGAAAAGAADRAVDLELPERVAVLRRPGGAVHPDVAAGAGDVQGLRAAGAGRGRVDRGPGGARPLTSGSGRRSRTRPPTAGRPG